MTTNTANDADGLTAEKIPTSFGVFKPVGWVMVGLPTQAQADALQAAMGRDAWLGATVVPFTPSESEAEMQAMADNAGGMAGFGYEITLLRRYVALTQQGYRWLLVKVRDEEQAALAASTAQTCGATIAVHYRMLTVEDLI